MRAATMNAEDAYTYMGKIEAKKRAAVERSRRKWERTDISIPDESKSTCTFSIFYVHYAHIPSTFFCPFLYFLLHWIIQFSSRNRDTHSHRTGNRDYSYRCHLHRTHICINLIWSSAHTNSRSNAHNAYSMVNRSRDVEVAFFFGPRMMF